MTIELQRLAMTIELQRLAMTIELQRLAMAIEPQQMTIKPAAGLASLRYELASFIN